MGIYYIYEYKEVFNMKKSIMIVSMLVLPMLAIAETVFHSDGSYSIRNGNVTNHSDGSYSIYNR